MQANTTKAPAAIRVDLAAIFVSLELSRTKWLGTSLSPSGGERMSRHLVSGGDIPGLLDHIAEVQRKAEVRTWSAPECRAPAARFGTGAGRRRSLCLVNARGKLPGARRRGDLRCISREKRRMFVSSINRCRSGLTGTSKTGGCMVGLLVEEARRALPLSDPAQCRRNDWPVSSTSPTALPRSGSSNRVTVKGKCKAVVHQQPAI